MSQANTHPDPLPRGLLMAMAALVLVALGGVSAVRLSGVSVRAPDAGTVLSRSLNFSDAADGGVLVTDAHSGQQVAHVQGEGGFLRGALRVMARERRLRGLGGAAPFELLGRADGRLTLLDPATGQRIDLEAFGPTNAGVFAALLNSPAPTVSPRSKP